ncbi:uncharacterized protein LOC128786832 [Vidua chalybeata]|uniref:uncharacterized protein LOC128786832 n=1 Tax=Vidua chalybeata TaxID=81927 RepID=UPI0023A7958C|nr:uncharacterized protein LOC128786832 [Vidua chalybeata]
MAPPPRTGHPRCRRLPAEAPAPLAAPAERADPADPSSSCSLERGGSSGTAPGGSSGTAPGGSSGTAPGGSRSLGPAWTATESIGLDWASGVRTVQPLRPRQGHLEGVTQERVRVGLEWLQRGRLHNLPGQLFQWSTALNVKEFFLKFRWYLLCLCFWSLLLVLSLGSTEKCLAPSSWHLPLRYPCAWLRSPSFFSRLNRPSSQDLLREMLQPPHHLCGPSLDPLQEPLAFLVLRSPDLHQDRPGGRRGCTDLFLTVTLISREVPALLSKQNYSCTTLR